ncbi:MAG: DUF2939 domain-containing protein [Bauldia sp.]
MLWSTSGIVAAFALIFGWVSWPYCTAVELANALTSGDQATLTTDVDWESLRAGLREDLNAELVKKAAADSSAKDSLGAGLTAALGPALMNGIIDAYVTPAGISALVIGKKSPASPQSEPTPTSQIGTASQAVAAPTQRSLDLSNVRWAFFDGPFGFRVDVASQGPKGGEEILTLLFGFDGRWRLKRIVFAPDTFETNAPS